MVSSDDQLWPMVFGGNRNRGKTAMGYCVVSGQWSVVSGQLSVLSEVDGQCEVIYF